MFRPWHDHPQEEQLHKRSIWYPRSHKRLYTTPVESGLSPLSTGVVYSRLEERGYQMLCLCSCSSWGWSCQGPKYVEDSNVTYMFILKCALKLVEEIILYYDARSKKHKIKLDRFKWLLLHHCCAVCWARRWKGKKFIQSFDKGVERNGKLGRHRRRYQRYIKIDLKVVGLKGVKWICFT